MAKIEIDGKQYDTDHISDQAKQALGAVQFTQMEIQRLQAQLAAMQTANMTYARGLKEALEQAEAQPAATPSAPDKPLSFSGDTLKFS